MVAKGSKDDGIRVYDMGIRVVFLTDVQFLQLHIPDTMHTDLWKSMRGNNDTSKTIKHQ